MHGIRCDDRSRDSDTGGIGHWIQGDRGKLYYVAVAAGDTIDFIADARGRDMHGTFTWVPVVWMEDAVWDAARTPRRNAELTSTPVRDEACIRPRSQVFVTPTFGCGAGQQCVD